jgi:hypothetical protein
METEKSETDGPAGAKALAGSRVFTALDFQRWGAQGGAKSKRTLTAEQARKMVQSRERKRRKTGRVSRTP